MKRIYGLYRVKKATASIGIFDGVHRGHQKIIKKLVQEAKRNRTKSLVITFHPHPRRVLIPSSNVPLLTSLEHRLKLMECLGVDFFLIIKFTHAFSQTKAEDFIKKVLVDKLSIKTLVVGENFSFGYKEKGDFSLLEKMGKKYGFRVTGIDPVRFKKKSISSTRIRSAIEKADLKNASLMLGRPVTILGTVVKGRKVGKELGFPTANIDPHHEAIPSRGVYAVDAKVQKKKYKAVVNIGTRPTFGKYREPTIELHILNFKKDIYKKDVEIIFKRKIRDERRFPSIEALRKQIQKDIARAG